MITATNYNQQNPNFQARMKMGQTSSKIGKYLDEKGINTGKALLASAGLAGTAGTVMLASPNAVSTPDAAKWGLGTGMLSTLVPMGSSYFKSKRGKEGAAAKTEADAEAKTNMPPKRITKVLDALDISYKIDQSDGLLILSEYWDPGSLERSDFVPNDLFNFIKKIEHDADFYDSMLTNLGNLQTIGGDADFSYSKLTNLGNLQTIGGNADFRYSRLTHLGDLQTIGGDVNLRHSKLKSLGNLQKIGGDVDFSSSKLINLGNLQTIGGDAIIEVSNLKPDDFASVKVGNKIISSSDLKEAEIKNINIPSERNYTIQSPIGELKLTQKGIKDYTSIIDSYCDAKAYLDTYRDVGSYSSLSSGVLLTATYLMEILKSKGDLSEKEQNIISGSFGKFTLTEKGYRQYLDLTQQYAKAEGYLHACGDCGSYSASSKAEKNKVLQKLNILSVAGEM